MSSDKSVGQWVGAFIGGVIGFFVGGPMGAIYGASIGAGIGGLIDPPKGPTLHGPRLQDMTVQTATFGAPIGRVYGTVALNGNVIWLENNQLKEVVRKKKQSGKGGGGTTVKTYHYYATFAVGLADAPPEGIKGVRRVWVGSELIYNNASGDLETIIASNLVSIPVGGKVKPDAHLTPIGQLWKRAKGASKQFVIYPGTDSQLPDYRIEAEMGVGNAPAFRGTAYIVFYDLPLEKWGNSLMGAQVKVELVTEITASAPRLIRTVEVPVSGDADGVGVINAFDAQAKSWVLSTSMPSNVAQGRLTEITTAGRRERVINRPASFPSDRKVYFVAGTSDRSRYWISHDMAPLSQRRISNGERTISIGVDRYVERIVEAQDTGLYVYHVTSTGDFDRKLQKINADGDLWTLGPSVAVAQGLDWTAVAVGSGMVALLDKTDPTTLQVRVYDPDLNLQKTFSVSYSPSVSYGTPAIIVAGYLFITRSFSGSDQLNLGQIDLEAETYVATYAVPAPGIGSPGASSFAPTLSYANGLFAFGGQYSGTPNRVKIYYFQIDHFDVAGVPLSDVVSAELQRSHLIRASDIDVTELQSDYVRGYRIAGVQQIRACIAPLQAAWPFDVIMSGYKLKAVRRGKSAVATIPLEHLDARGYDDSPGIMLENQREMDSQLPRQMLLRHLDPMREHDVNEQRSSERMSTEAVDVREIELPLVLTPDEAAGVADVLFNVAWLERESVSFRLPPIYLGLEPADVITIDAPYGQFELRLMEVNYTPDGRLECRAKPNAAANYTSVAVGGEGPVPDGKIPLTGDAETALMDIPLIRNDDDEPVFAAAMSGMSSSWPGGVLFRSSDTGQTWTDVQAWTAPVTMGWGRDPLPAHDGLVIDRVNSLRVDLTNGELESITEDQMMTGMHWAAYGADGRWELIRFATATLQSDGSYVLSTLLRGLRGTEWATGLHQYGDSFVLLDDPDVMAIGADLQALGVVRQWRGVSAGRAVDDAETIEFAYRGVNLRPLSGVHGQAQQSGADWIITWNPRTRLQGSWWKTGVRLPVGEASESYEVDILDGATVVRTLASTTPTVTYTEAQQIDDFGSAQSAITARVYQLSQSVGRGYPLEVSA